MTIPPTPLDYVPVSRLDAPSRIAPTSYKQPSGIKRGLYAGSMAAIALTFAYFFPVATAAFGAMCFAVWAGEKLYLYFEMPAEEPS